VLLLNKLGKTERGPFSVSLIAFLVNQRDVISTFVLKAFTIHILHRNESLVLSHFVICKISGRKW
jgi:hypothetical protein